MILFTRFKHGAIAINPDLIERVEATPDTVITLVDDKKLLVTEPLDEVIRLITDYRAYVIARSKDLEVVEEPRPTLHIVPPETVVATHGHPNDSDQEGEHDNQVIAHPSATDRDSETS